MKLEEIHSAYFIGIGGIGMSALARWMKWKGIRVSGYDRTPSELTEKLISEDIEIHFKENIETISGLDKEKTLIVYTPAVPKNHKELIHFQTNGFEVMKRSEVLGQISKEIKTIAVAGTHGKTTTCSMIAHIFKYNNLNSTALVGGILSNYNSNLVLSGNPSNTEWMILEADEFDRSFLTLSPEIAVITSIDPDHLDIYGDEQTIKTAFSDFSSRIKPEGHFWINHSANENLDASKFKGSVKRTYGIEEGEVRASNFSVDGSYRFDYQLEGKTVDSYELQIPGRHNIENAIAAISVARNSGLEHSQIKEALSNYKGVKRRFEYIIKSERLVYIDDYAHHPTEIKALLNSVRELYPTKRIKAIFQPHLYSRTRDFQDGFAESLSLADETILLDIYPAREEPIPGVSSEIIFKKMKASQKRLLSKEELVDQIEIGSSDVLLTIGAGDIDKLVKPLKLKLEQSI
ncbi:MAG: UDP-N-acetylmuramate--L-alanine ligase [Bacteroidota bacterium]